MKRNAKQYDIRYEGGRCPYGYEYVNSFEKADGTFIMSYCRKIKKHRFTDPDNQGRNLREKMKKDSEEHVRKIYFGDNRPEYMGEEVSL